MVQHDRIFGGLLSSQSFKEENSYAYNENHIQPRILMDTKITNNQHTDIHVNSSNHDIVSMTGSHAVLFKDTNVNMTNVIDRPITLIMQSHPLLLFSILLVLVLLIFIVAISWVYHRAQRRRRRRRRLQQEQAQDSEGKRSILRLRHDRHDDSFLEIRTCQKRPWTSRQRSK